MIYGLDSKLNLTKEKEAELRHEATTLPTTNRLEKAHSSKTHVLRQSRWQSSYSSDSKQKNLYLTEARSYSEQHIIQQAL